MSRNEAFFAAIAQGNLEAVKSQLRSDPDLATAKNEKGQSAVLLAAYNGKKVIRDFLLAQNIPLALHEAAATGQLARVMELVAGSPASANAFSPDGFPVVSLSAFLGHLAVTEYLVEQGAGINAISTNGSGYTALTGAVASGQTEVVGYLLSHGANANYRYGLGYSPLLTAAANGHLAIVKLLLAHGADPHAHTDDHQDALALAESRGHQEVTALLRS
jgi:uncharacterized protein